MRNVKTSFGKKFSVKIHELNLERIEILSFILKVTENWYEQRQKSDGFCDSETTVCKREKNILWREKFSSVLTTYKDYLGFILFGGNQCFLFWICTQYLEIIV